MDVVDAANGQIQKLIAFVTGMIFFFAGYALMPLMFRLAGGMVATIGGFANDKSRGVFDSQKKKRQGLRDQQKERLGRQALQKRAKWADSLQSSASKESTGWIGGKLKRGAARAVGGYNVEAAMSGRRAAVGKEVNDQIATGRDEEVRGLTVNRNAADSQWHTGQTLDADGNTYAGTNKEDALRRTTKDGTVQYKSLGGAWVNDAHVRAGQKRWGNDHFAQQAALSYEMRKASSEDEIQGIAERYNDTATQQWGQTQNQANGTWIGSAFENQNKHLEYKRMSWGDDAATGAKGVRKFNHDSFVDEIYENKGSYNMAQMGSNTIEQLKTSYNDAVSSGNVGRQQKIQAVAETFMRDMGGVGGAIDPDTGQQLGGGGPIDSRRQANTPGAAHVAERVSELADLVGVRNPSLPNTPNPTAITGAKSQQ